MTSTWFVIYWQCAKDPIRTDELDRVFNGMSAYSPEYPPTAAIPFPQDKVEGIHPFQGAWRDCLKLCIKSLVRAILSHRRRLLS
jgi:hypothetical protein